MSAPRRLFLFALLLVPRPLAAAVLINEFDRDAAVHNVELYNNGGVAVSLTGWTLTNGVGGTLALAGSIPAGGFLTFGMAALVPEGGQIELVDGTSVIRDQVAFGDAGGAPLPPLNGGYSCCRAPNGSDTNNDATDWTLDPSDTFLAGNNAPSPILGGHTVKSNEAGTAGAAPSGAFVCSGADLVELYNSGGGSVSLTGWTLTDGRDVKALSGSVGAGSVTVISGFPVNFCFEETQVLYLFDNLGRRVDQWGFAGSGLPNSTVSWQRFPDGSGPYNGYDFLTSGGGSTVFVVAESFGFLNGNTPPLPTTPTMSEWGLIVLSLAVLATGMVASRRRRTTAG